MDLSKTNVIAGILPAFGDLLLNNTLITSQKTKDQLVAIHYSSEQYAFIESNLEMILDVEFNRNGEYLMSRDSKEVVISKMGESFREWEQVYRLQLDQFVYFSWIDSRVFLIH
jgi:hypothetical protein